MRKWLPLVAICTGTFMLLVDVTIVNVALPDIATDLGTTFSQLQWVVDVYALALAALVLGAGSLADLYGRRRLYLIGLVLFALASLACGLAPNAGCLIAARGVQGIGGAIMFATTIALINTSYEGRDRGTAFGVWGAVVGASAALGPILGGALTELSWRWIFFVNLPVCVLAVVLTLTAVAGGPAAERPAARRPRHRAVHPRRRRRSSSAWSARPPTAGARPVAWGPIVGGLVVLGGVGAASSGGAPGADARRLGCSARARSPGSCWRALLLNGAAFAAADLHLAVAAVDRSGSRRCRPAASSSRCRSLSFVRRRAPAAGSCRPCRRGSSSAAGCC